MIMFGLKRGSGKIDFGKEKDRSQNGVLKEEEKEREEVVKVLSKRGPWQLR